LIIILKKRALSKRGLNEWPKHNVTVPKNLKMNFHYFAHDISSRFLTIL